MINTDLYNVKRERYTWILLIWLLSCGDNENDPLSPQDQLLEITEMYPVEGQVNVPVDTSFHIFFENKLDESSVEPLSVVLIHDREILDAKLTYSTNENLVSLTPGSELTHNSQYTLSIPEGLKGLDGAVVEARSWSFFTKEKVEMESIPVTPINEVMELVEGDTTSELSMTEEEMEIIVDLDPTSYTATFEAVWSNETHPTDFPTGPHFSGLIGLTHDGESSLFSVGELATTGIKDMAELGSKINLISQINLLIEAGSGQNLISGGGIGVSPGSVSVDFDIESSHPYVTITSMLAPSPDWFIAIRNINLIENNAWIDSMTLQVGIYDAGTDSGSSFASPNLVTSPPESIDVIITPPLAEGGVVSTLGSITLTRITE